MSFFAGLPPGTSFLPTNGGNNLGVGRTPPQNLPAPGFTGLLPQPGYSTGQQNYSPAPILPGMSFPPANGGNNPGQRPSVGGTSPLILPISPNQPAPTPSQYISTPFPAPGTSFQRFDVPMASPAPLATPFQQPAAVQLASRTPTSSSGTPIAFGPIGGPRPGISGLFPPTSGNNVFGTPVPLTRSSVIPIGSSTITVTSSVVPDNIPVTTAPKKGKKGREPIPSPLYQVIYNYIITSGKDLPSEVVNIIRSLSLTRRSEQGNFKIGNNEGSLFYQDSPPKGKGRVKVGGGKTFELSTSYTVNDMTVPTILEKVTNDIIAFIRKYAVIAERITEPVNIDIRWSIFAKTMQADDLLRQFFTTKIDNLDTYVIDRLVSQIKLLLAIGTVAENNVIMKRNPDSSVEIQQIDGVTIIQNQTTGELNIVPNNNPPEPIIGPEQASALRANLVNDANTGLLASNSYYTVSGLPERSIAVFSKMSEKYGTRQI